MNENRQHLNTHGQIVVVEKCTCIKHLPCQGTTLYEHRHRHNHQDKESTLNWDQMTCDIFY